MNWLVGARVTATDQSGSLENLRRNLHRNTRGIQRHQPQVTALTFDPDQHHAKCHYDYVLAAEVIYHHDCFTKLLVTMRHFCRPGTNLIWAIKVFDPSDLALIEDFNKAFHATMLAELDGVRIYLATHGAIDDEDAPTKSEEKMEKWQTRRNCTEEENLKRQNSKVYSGDIKHNGHCEQAVIHNQKAEEKENASVSGIRVNLNHFLQVIYKLCLFLLITFQLLSQMTQMIQINSYLVRRFGNPSIPTYLAKRFTSLWVTNSSSRSPLILMEP